MARSTETPKARIVTYGGPEGGSLVRTAYEIDNRGKTYRLVEGQPQSVPNEVADRLAAIEGHKFQIKEALNER